MATTSYARVAPALTNAIRDVYSRDILFTAQPIMKFEQFAVNKTELGVAPGLVVKFLKYNNLTLGGKLTNETTAIVTQNLTSSLKSITVYEYANGVSVSELLLAASFDDVLSSSAKLLGMDYAKVIDGVLRDVFIGCTNVVYTNGSSRSAVTTKFDTVAVKDAAEVLATNNAPKFNGDFYVCFVHPHQARDIRDDSAWLDATKYQASERIFNGEIGRYEDVKFIETTQMPIISAGGGGSPGADVYQSVMFGDNAVGRAISLPVELRDDGITDFGRIHKLAYYSIEGSEILEDSNICRIESA